MKAFNMKKMVSVFVALLMVLTVFNGVSVIPAQASESADVAKIGEQGYSSLELALGNVKDGETIELLSDATLNTTFIFDKEGTYTINGNGFSIKQDEDYVFTGWGAGLMLGNSLYDDTQTKTHKVIVQNTVFDGWTGESVFRTQGVTLELSGCTFENGKQDTLQSILRLDYTEATIENSTFQNNEGLLVIGFNYNGDPSLTNLVVDECIFQNNTCNSAAVLQYATGSSCTITNSKFISNKVSSTGNAATVYFGFKENTTVTGCVFKDNVVETSHATSVRVSGAIMIGYETTITGNVFENNSASRTNSSDELGQSVCASIYYTDIDLSGNYWDGAKPVSGTDYYVEYPNSGNKLIIDSFKCVYKIDESTGALSFTHAEEKLVNTKTASCTEDGYTGDKICSVCEEVLTAGTTIQATGHTYKDGVCACGHSIKVEAEVVAPVEKEEVVTEKVEIKEVTVVEDEHTVKAEATVSAQATEIITAVVTEDKEAVEELVKEEVISKETAESIQKTVESGDKVVSEIVVEEVKAEEVAKEVQTAIAKEAVEEIHKEAKVAQFLDVSVFLKSAKTDETLGTINKLATPITITVAIPDDLQETGRVFYVIRNHDGVVEVLETTNNGNGTISFTTDQFSTYALAYKDVKAAPATGDSSAVMSYTVVAIVALAVVVVLKKRNSFAR